MSNAYIEFYLQVLFSSSHKPYLLLRYEVQSESVGIFLYTFYISLPRSLLPQIHRIAQILCCNAITISYNTNSVISVIFIQQFRIMRSENKRSAILVQSAVHKEA